jgi:hypothetical protein
VVVTTPPAREARRHPSFKRGYSGILVGRTKAVHEVVPESGSCKIENCTNGFWALKSRGEWREWTFS